VLIGCPQGQYAKWFVVIRFSEYRPQRYTTPPPASVFQTEAVLRLKGWRDRSPCRIYRAGNSFNRNADAGTPTISIESKLSSSTDESDA